MLSFQNTQRKKELMHEGTNKQEHYCNTNLIHNLLFPAEKHAERIQEKNTIICESDIVSAKRNGNENH